MKVFTSSKTSIVRTLHSAYCLLAVVCVKIRTTIAVFGGEIMTANQINAARQREDNRHNLETERQGRDVIVETNRHNVQQEKIGWGQVGVGYAQVAEMKRHNVATERLNMYDVTSQRDLRRAQSKQARSQADLAAAQANLAQANADVRQYEVTTNRINARTRERELTETQRQNQFMDSIARYNADVNRYNAETQRRSQEQTNWFREQQIEESKRHNRATEEATDYSNTSGRIGVVSGLIGTVFGRQGLIGGIGSLVGGSK